MSAISSSIRPVPVILLFAMFTFVSGGCSPSKAVVTGKVSYKGELVTTGEIHFIGEAGESRSSAIGSDGKYQIDDAPVGPITVTIVATKLTSKTEKAQPAPDGESPPEPVQTMVTTSLVPKKYNDPQTSKLNHTIKRGAQTIDFPLED